MRISGLTPALITATLITPSAGALVTASDAPTVQVSEHVQITPSAGALVVAGSQPLVGADKTITPTVGAVSFTGIAPSLLQQYFRTPTLGALNVAGLAPTLKTDTRLTPTVGAVVIASSQPLVGGDKVLTPTVGAVVVAGSEPTVQVSGQEQITPSAGALEIAGSAPTVQAPVAITPSIGALILAGSLPTVQTGGLNTDITPTTGELLIGEEGSWSIQPAAGALVITGEIPGGADTRITPTTGTLSMAPPTLGWTWTPSSGEDVTDWYVQYGRESGIYTQQTIITDETLREIEAWRVLTAGPGAWYVRLQAYADDVPGTASNELLIDSGIPTVQIGAGNTDIRPSRGTLTLTGLVPPQDIAIIPTAGSLTVTGIVPTVQASEFLLRVLTPSAGALVTTGLAPRHDLALTPSAGSLVLTGIAAQLSPTRTEITPAAGSLILTGNIGNRAEVFCYPSAGSLVVSGSLVTIQRAGGATYSSGTFPAIVVAPAKLTGGTPMSRSSLREAIQLRLGDPDGVFMPDAYAHTLITEAQEIMAEHGPPVMRRVGIPIKQHVTFYRLTEYASDAMAPVRIFSPGRSAALDPTTQEELDGTRPGWMNDTGAPSAWFARGWNQFGLYPKSATDGGLLWVDYLAWPQTLLHDAAESEYGPEDRECIIAYGWYDGVLLGAQVEEIKPAWETFQALLKRSTERRANLNKDRIFRLQAGGNGHR